MTTITEFMAARLAEKAAAAWSVHDVAKCDALLYEDDMAEAARRDPDCDCGQPARVLREVAAMRAILPHVVIDGHPLDHCDRCMILRHLAAVNGDHPDYEPEWAQEGTRP